MDKQDLYGIILAGGTGSRLWPLSRELCPKQLLKLNNEHTLFQSAVLRLAEFIPASRIITATNTKLTTDIKLQLNHVKNILKLSDDFKIMVEPAVKNTAPAISLSVMYILKKLAKEGSDPFILVSPGDHIVKNNSNFNKAINEGLKLAEEGYIVAFGVKPEKADTGFGYINTISDNKISDIVESGLKVKEFKEKPDLEAAKKYYQSESSFWNSGILLFKASTLINELKLYHKEVLENILNCEFNNTGLAVDFDSYNQMPDISIDYAIMEHSEKITLVPLNCDWTDMGSWEAIYNSAQKDIDNNFISGNVIDIDSENSIIYGTSKLVSTIGLKDIVLVETEDAILACDKNRTQDVMEVYNQLKTNNNSLYQVHKTVYRPWGCYTALQRGEGFLIKIIQVNPEAKLSLQMHYHRSEHWVVLSGMAKVIRDAEEIYLKPGESTDIPQTMKHSLQNPGKTELKIIEVQNGDYLEEDDIVRFDDIYGRAAK